MLFNSFEFLFLFLPVTLLVFCVFSYGGYGRLAISWLVIASLFFYAWWNPVYLVLLLGSVIFNFLLGNLLNNKSSTLNQVKHKYILAFGIVGNLGLLGYFKYFGFLIENTNRFLGTEIGTNDILLPLAISFFTFQQIAYLVDSYQGKVQEHNLTHYLLFVTFFPQLIAGPIVHHSEMMPQILGKTLYKLKHRNITVGLTIIVIGLAKKVLIADNIGDYADPVFAMAAEDSIPGFFEAWSGVFAYSFQLYFDFSGYTDMAIGLALMFNVRLPANFESPYKANNIIEFWRRWHMTLSRFLKDYLYIPLGGNRKGNVQRYLNMMITMFLGGLWHGAAWTFVFWGIFHGVLLSINHAWHAVKKRYFQDSGYHFTTAICLPLSKTLTVLLVCIGWVLFRSDDVHSAQRMLHAMFSPNWHGIDITSLLPADQYKEIASIFSDAGFGVILGDSVLPIMNIVLSSNVLLTGWLIVSAAIVFIAPNSIQIQRRIERYYPTWLMVATGFLLFACLLSFIKVAPAEFVYFQF